MPQTDQQPPIRLVISGTPDDADEAMRRNGIEPDCFCCFNPHENDDVGVVHQSCGIEHLAAVQRWHEEDEWQGSRFDAGNLLGFEIVPHVVGVPQ